MEEGGRTLSVTDLVVSSLPTGLAESTGRRGGRLGLSKSTVPFSSFSPFSASPSSPFRRRREQLG